MRRYPFGPWMWACLVTVACFACGTSPEVSGLPGEWQVANGTFRITCPDGTESTTFQTWVWFSEVNSRLLVRSEDRSICEYRFRVTETGAEIVPGQWCEEYGFGEDGGFVVKRLQPRTWTVLHLEGDLLWEAYEVDVLVQSVRGAQVCTLRAAATLARNGR